MSAIQKIINPVSTEEIDITAEFINGLAYPDFVGFINQWNVLPGSHVTLSKWINFANITAESRLMQFACTTGFQSREIAMRTGCKAKAFDLSPYAIWAAKYNVGRYAPDAKVEYFCADGHTYDSDEKFTHVAIGAGLQFFKDPQHTLKRCISFLEDGGYFLASPFYLSKELPDELVKKAQTVFGITPTTKGYKDIMSMYQDLEILYEDRNDLTPETEKELKNYCEATIKRTCDIHGILDNEIYETMYDRLYRVKEMSNLLRPYQRYSTLVLRYRECVYPNRYVELF